MPLYRAKAIFEVFGGFALALLIGAQPAAAGGGAAAPAPDGPKLSSSDKGRVHIFDWSWFESGGGGGRRAGSAALETPVVLDHFTPRLTGLSLSLPGASGPADIGEKGSGAGFDYDAGTIVGAPVSVTIGGGFTSRQGPSLDFTEPLTYDTAGLGGRVRISHVSLGSAFFHTRATRFGTGARDNVGTGYDLDLSYSFEAGTLSLQRFSGVGQELAGEGPARSHQSVAVAGNYLVGPGLDMTAWLGYGDAGSPGVVQSEIEGWSLLTGFHLAF